MNTEYAYLKEAITDRIDESYNDHLSSLRYAGIIQKALMPDPGYLKGLFKDYFILFMPRDIVSGDFYYVFSNRSYIFVAAGDCTGHGVPGALLSIMGISFLNEILQCRTDHKANRVLNLMREKVMKALHQTGEKTETKDSIDIGFCIIDRTSGSMQYSGANRPLMRVRDGQVTEFKPDKMTIGVAPLREQPFANQVLDIQPGDSFYLFSDGYSDQFGGPYDKKFKHKRLRNLLADISARPMESQRSMLMDEFNQWRGVTQQVDDVLVFGFKL